MKKSLEDHAEALGITRDTLRLWRKAGCPDPRTHTLDEVREWADAHMKKVSGGGDRKEQMLTAKLKREIEAGRKLQIENDRRQGLLVERAWVVGMHAKMAAMLQESWDRNLLTEVEKFAAAGTDLDANRMEVQSLKERFYSILNSVVDEMRNCEVEIVPEEPADTPAKKKALYRAKKKARTV